MNAELLFETMGDINEDFIKEAVQMERKKNYKWIKYAVAAAACLGIDVGIGVFAVTVYDRTHNVYPSDPIPIVSDTTVTEPGDIIEESSDSGMGGDYNAAIMIGGIVYWDTYKTMPDEPDETNIQYAETYSESGMPEKDGETNFAREPGTRYAVLDDGTVVVEIDGEWTIFEAKETTGASSVDGTVPGGSVSAGIDPVKASIAVFPYSESLSDVADATLTEISEMDAKGLDGIGSYIPAVLPEGWFWQNASIYETTMNDGTVYRMLRIRCCRNSDDIAAPGGGTDFTDEFYISITNFEPKTEKPIYSIDELHEDIDLSETFHIAVGDAYAIVSADMLTYDELMSVLRSMNG